MLLPDNFPVRTNALRVHQPCAEFSCYPLLAALRERREGEATVTPKLSQILGWIIYMPRPPRRRCEAATDFSQHFIVGPTAAKQRDKRGHTASLPA